MRLLPALAAYHAHKCAGDPLATSERINATRTVQAEVTPEDVPHLLAEFGRDVAPLGELSDDAPAHLVACGHEVHVMRGWARSWGAELSGAPFRRSMGRRLDGCRLQDLALVTRHLVNHNAVTAGERACMHANTLLAALATVDHFLSAQVLRVYHAGAGVKWWLPSAYGEAIGVRRDGQPEGLVCEVLRAGEALVGFGVDTGVTERGGGV